MGSMRPLCSRRYIFAIVIPVAVFMLMFTSLQQKYRIHSCQPRGLVPDVTDDANMTVIDYRGEDCGPSTSCGRFRSLLATWEEGRPKAAIYILIGGMKENLFSVMLESLYAMFNDKFQYPVLAFHERGYDTSPYSGRYKWLFFVEISFISPREIPPRIHGRNYDMGYLHMCRFHAWMVYTHPVMYDLEYAWRLDSDSRLNGPPMTYDIFKFMKDNNLVYGYVGTTLDGGRYVKGLWESVLDYANENNITGTFFYCWRRRRVFYNNFEISKQSLWNSKDYSDYFAYLDNLGGIYRHRWGDSPIKGIAVALFVPVDKVHKFVDVGYSHGNWMNRTGFSVAHPTLNPISENLPCLEGKHRVIKNVRFPKYSFKEEKAHI